jgi:hypothetical protein
MDEKTRYTFDELYEARNILRQRNKEFIFNGKYVGNICNVNPLPKPYIGFINYNDDSECGVEKTDGKLSLYTDKGIVIYYTESGDNLKDEFEIYELEIYEPIKC